MIEIFQAGFEKLWGFIADAGVFFATQTVDNINEVINGFTKGNIEAFGIVLPLVILILQFNLLMTVLKVLQMIWFLSHGVRSVWKIPKSYSVLREGGKSILIIGDSTAYGVGADKPEDTIAGRLGHDFPQTEIVNTAVNGSLTRDAIKQLHQAGPKKFDLIIICTGGNDIWHFTRLSSLERDLEHLLKEANELSGNQVILLFYANLGNAAIFPNNIRFILGKRTKGVHEVFSKVSTALQVPLVELYTSKQTREFTDPFVIEPEKYYSKDRMHPSSEGYRLWYNRMWREMITHHFVFAESGPAPIVFHESNTTSVDTTSAQ